MNALSPVSRRMSALASGGAASKTEPDSGFARTLALLTGDGDGDTPPASTPAQRHEDAEDGKALPDADPAGSSALDPRLLWLPVGLPPAPPVTLPAGLAKPVPVVAPVPVAAAAAADPLSVVTPAEGKASDTGSPKAPEPTANGDAAFLGKLTDLFHTAERLVDTPAAAAPMPAQAQPQPAQVSTVALPAEFAALGFDPTARADRKKAAADPAFQPTTMTTEVALQNAVQPTGDAKHVPLDLRGETGLQKTIDRIETLRDGADANDTRIRLIPDALGQVDISVRRAGDAVHVHFTAENAATRALLTEAQPRLVELADARGVRIAGASVDAGAGGGGQHAQAQRQPQAPVTNHTVSTPTEAAGDDARLA